MASYLDKDGLIYLWSKIKAYFSGKAEQIDLDDHTTNTENPHNVTAEQIDAAPSEHDHEIADIINLQTALDYKADVNLITVEDIDEICNVSIVSASEVEF